jgi:hypothetical protein
MEFSLKRNLEMEVWGWDKGGWECTQTTGADGDLLNPNSIVSAAHQGTQQVCRSGQFLLLPPITITCL